MPHSSELCVGIQSAANLPKMDVLGSCDAYCILQWGDDQRKTSTIKGSYNPTWNEEFRFLVSQGQTRDLEVKVMDWDRMTKDDEVGIVTISSAQIEEIMSKQDAADLVLNLPLTMGGKEVKGKQKDRPSTITVRLSKQATVDHKATTESEPKRYGMMAESKNADIVQIAEPADHGKCDQQIEVAPLQVQTLGEKPGVVEHAADARTSKTKEEDKGMKSAPSAFVGRGYMLGRGSLKQVSNAIPSNKSKAATRKLLQSINHLIKNESKMGSEKLAADDPRRSETTFSHNVPDTEHDFHKVRESTKELQSLLASMIARKDEVCSEERSQEILSPRHKGYESERHQPWTHGSIKDILDGLAIEDGVVEDKDFFDDKSLSPHKPIADETVRESNTNPLQPDDQLKKKFLVVHNMKLETPQAFTSRCALFQLTAVMNESVKSKTNKVVVCSDM
mmetsp:Transcript_51796/g.161175  ORF Transcript_51796/g.161175 Transcript_51796/m.161175 type:complete len:448 (-) Transcript_51796:56-1399(-)